MLRIGDTMTAYIDVRITFEETVIDEGEEDSFTDYTPISVKNGEK